MANVPAMTTDTEAAPEQEQVEAATQPVAPMGGPLGGSLGGPMLANTTRVRI